MVRLIIGAIALALAALAGFVGYRASTFTAPPPPAEAAIPDLNSYAVNADAAAARLSQAIRFRTVSLVGDTGERDQFEQFHTWMRETYPAFHAVARLEPVNELSLLYTWEGSDPAQPPLLLLAHQDTVPVPQDTRAQWRIDPFAGVIADGSVWGRGAIDDKASVIAILEAVELLAASGKRPTRTVILAFGHDEEVMGAGAAAMAGLLQQRGVRAWFALDEGMATVARHPLTDRPASLIGISEKGFGTLRITAVGQPGHSSMPPRETAVSRLALAVTAIHDMPIDRSLGNGPGMMMMRALAPDLSPVTRTALSNEWLFAPLLRVQLADNPAAQALLGTTVAPTMTQGGSRPNVLPAEATARINLRIHPRDNAADLLARAQGAVSEIEGVSVDWDEPPNDASPVSSVESSSYALIAALAGAAVPDTPVAPSLVLGATDARHYVGVAENVYRYQPIILTEEDLEGIHGVNEHISVENFTRMVRFYAGLIEAGAM
ncbi:MAG: M20/M25/M40 family metallo-hydrolase [Hyphomonadaceae bacterium]|nr:M20/M25/M40 family metallo-hydrolase [Hyphomonadaceae bacterium]